MTADRTITVFGGTGFLGSRIVHHLADNDYPVRIASRHPERAQATSVTRGREIDPIHADVNSEASVAGAVAGAFAVVNAVSLYVERGEQTFQSVHVEAAERLARHAQRSGVDHLIHVSGIGANEQSDSPYIRSRARGEMAVRAAFPAATIVRPAVMFGPGDSFLAPLIKLLRRFPVFLMFGRGNTRLQPSYVEDVGKAIVRALQQPTTEAAYELGGPDIFTYKELLTKIADHLEVQRILLPLPFGLWRAAGLAAELLPQPPLTRNQIELMQVDNVASPGAPGFASLGIAPRTIESVLPAMIQPV